MKENSKMMQEAIVIDATRLIKKYSEQYGLPPKWVMSRFDEGGPKGRTIQTRVESSHARHRVITELADMGYPRDLIARSFDLGRDAVNSIIRKFRQQQNEQQH
tara:strand:- start:683 stop:991 length:309 start_codon:yes stop_codon:yes gene_type:complete